MDLGHGAVKKAFPLPLQCRLRNPLACWLWKRNQRPEERRQGGWQNRIEGREEQGMELEIGNGE